MGIYHLVPQMQWDSVQPALPWSFPSLFIPSDSHFFREAQRHQANCLHEVFSLSLSFQWVEMKTFSSFVGVSSLRAEIVKFWRYFPDRISPTRKQFLPYSFRRAAFVREAPRHVASCPSLTLSFWTMGNMNFGLCSVCLSRACVPPTKGLWQNMTVEIHRPPPHTDS